MTAPVTLTCHRSAPMFGRMRRSVCLGSTVVLLASGGDLEAQLRTRLHVGAVYSSSLVRDSIVQRVTVRPEIAPAAALAAGWEVTPRWHIDGELALSQGGLIIREAGTAREILTLTTLGATGGVTGSITGALAARAGVGLIHYRPSAAKGPFNDGASTHAVGTVSVSYRRPIWPDWALGAELRYQAHAFSTTELRTHGFFGDRLVHRIGVGLSVERRWMVP